MVQYSRRLSVLPAAVGLLGVVWALVGAWAAGVTDGNGGGIIAVAVAGLVGATVLSGSGAGLYAGLALLAVASLAGGDDVLDVQELLALGLALVVIHETVRFSLDARRPARLGPGLVGGYLARTVAVGALVALTIVLLDRLSGTSVESPGWIPVGLAAAALPVLTLAAAARLPDGGWPGAGQVAGLRIATIARLAVTVGFTVAVLAVVVLAATARSTIDTSIDRGDEAAVTTTTTTVPPVSSADGAGEPAEFRRGMTLLFLIGATLLFGAVYLALRRPEAVFELDDLDYDEDDTGVGFAPPGRADTESTVDVDDDELARLLAELRLDIEAQADPGRAVRFAYANVERRLAELDLPKQADETEREFLARALATLDDGTALTDLTKLFEQARFGTDAADESMRRKALSAINDLERALAAPDSTPDPGPAAANEPGPAPSGDDDTGADA
ncbi:MAG: DUF4129 domain-containing protein [Actinomycetota bacterium]